MATPIDLNVEPLQKCLKAVQDLRASVSFVFDTLNEGITATHTTEEKEKQFIAELRESLSKVNTNIEELDKNAAAFPSANNAMSLGNLGLLMADPTIDKTPLHSQVLQVYKWSSQVHDYATIACTMLHNSATKRSLGAPGVMAAKRQRRAAINSLNTQPIDMTIQNLMRIFNTDITITSERPFGSPAVLQVTVGRTLKALVILRGLVIEWVTVKAFNEEVRHENGKLDLWSPSRYLVFQKVTSHARSALLHFCMPHITGSIIDTALKSFLMWLQSYKTLFSTSCLVCGQLMKDNLPPTWRDFRTMEAYHEQCLWKQ